MTLLKWILVRVYCSLTENLCTADSVYVCACMYVIVQVSKMVVQEDSG